MANKFFLYSLYAALAFLPALHLDADRGGGGGGRGPYGGAHYSNRHNVDPNSYWNGVNNGYYGGGVIDNGAVIIDPNAGSGAGMTDDSDELYQSYLDKFGTME